MGWTRKITLGSPIEWFELLERFYPRLHTLPMKCLLLALAFILTSRAEEGWFEFNPPQDDFSPAPIDLRHLNEEFAGQHGFIAARGDEFIFPDSQQPVRFWAVNGPSHELAGDALKKSARRLAKYGVNLCRLHTGVFDKEGRADLKKIAHTLEIVEALKAEGIYSHFSIYFPLWLQPKPDHPLLKGYDGQTHPFAALMFNRDFQKQYQDWWRALLTTPDSNGKRLIDEPAVFGVEVQNEDSFFFWTFDPKRIPDPQMRILEAQFAEWLKKQYGSLDAAFVRWDNLKVERDNLAENRVSFRPLWNIANERKQRDKDTALFLTELQRNFYRDTYEFLRGLGFKGLITASNWSTASPEYLGPLEKWTYAATDFIDRHGYFGVEHKGDNSAWSIRNDHTYADRSALRFENTKPGGPKQFVHPAMDPGYDNKPSMISETTWNRPNRFRSEAPIYFAAFGALQGTDAIVHFAYDGDRWSVKPNFWMQPWTLMAPSQMAQFPAAALLYRQGLVKGGAVLAQINLNTNDLTNLKGTPLPQDASLDELRLKDLPAGGDIKPGQRIDPLIHYAGRANVSFTGTPGKTEVADLKPYIDHSAKTVRSSTGELQLNYGKGLLTINSPRAQGASGDLRGGAIDLKDIRIESEMDNGHILLVPLDNQPLAVSKKMLLQVMSEEQPTDFAATENSGLKKITNLGRDPWLVKNIRAKIRFNTQVVIAPLDQNGYPGAQSSKTSEMTLDSSTIYYQLVR